MKRLRIKADAAGGAWSETPIFESEARHESIDSDGSITTAASKTINDFEPVGILNGTFRSQPFPRPRQSRSFFSAS
jgi:hypothetical protein